VIIKMWEHFMVVNVRLASFFLVYVRIDFMVVIKVFVI